jgi:parallel beta-helix repeat protein
MKIRIVSLAVCVMFLTGFVNAYSVEICSNSEDSVIYVDDDGGADYTKIQDAIDNASNGDTVFVFNGTYIEQVNVNKTINLTGEDKDITIIDGYIKIDANYVNITGFKVQNSSWGLGGFYVTSSYNKICENIITNCGDGIALVENTSFNIIIKNIITDNMRNGINNWFDFSNNNIIKGNTITNNWYNGIKLIGKNNNISNNIINNNDVGIYLWNPNYSNNTIYENTISHNKREGINLKFTDENYLYKNHINNNGHEGIILESSSNNIISGNTITNNKNGISLSWGSDYNIINFNTISNQFYGIWMVISSNNNLISDNNFIKNNFGLYISGSFENNVTSNNFRQNILHAFFINCNNTLWYGNYWNRPRLLPKPIFGLKIKQRLWIPCINFDSHPVKEPYDI